MTLKITETVDMELKFKLNDEYHEMGRRCIALQNIVDEIRGGE